ncbi:cystatin 4 precursor [Zea mays]|uniref:Cysteine proteinase inhibitor n=1 Tax=Zea mays TaxID=4577 RepID=B4FV48_MAIZE|nr:cystatin 4 precursor [Zea mays]ACF85991.1 unknown [Zea mays]ACG32708.1 multidomain cystatin [Zea mays]AQK89345.1 cystatin4 [Zea mays]AQK89346.1 cystatin4 [Zea mays]|eukprot:NP_001295431.1 cystatin 4 precursor [Zea mays]
MRVAATRAAAAAHPPSAFLLLLLLLGCASLAIGGAAMAGHVLGGVKENPAAANSAESDGLGRFAVDEHNRRENALLEFVRVVEAKEQVVAGTLHHLTLEAVEAGRKKLYEAKVWVKPWLDFKELQEFSHKGDATAFTNADLGAKQGGHEPGWREVPVEDPVVKDAAHHAVKSIQERSNSLFPYELLEILRAHAQVVEDFAKFDILMKLKRGSKEEKIKAEVHKSLEGAFVLNQHQPAEHDESSSQ